MSKKQEKSVEKVSKMEAWCKDCKSRKSGASERKSGTNGLCVTTNEFVNRKHETCDKFKPKGK